MTKNQSLRKEVIELEGSLKVNEGMKNKERQLDLINQTLRQKTRELEEIFVQYGKLQ